MTELETLFKQTEQLWKNYVFGSDAEIVEGIREIFSPDCVVIGTGRHEVYMNLHESGSVYRSRGQRGQRAWRYSLSVPGLLV